MRTIKLVVYKVEVSIKDTTELLERETIIIIACMRAKQDNTRKNLMKRNVGTWTKFQPQGERQLTLDRCLEREVCF